MIDSIGKNSARRENRGEAWVAAQGALLVLFAAAPRWEAPWPAGYRRLGKLVGASVALAGAALMLPGLWQLGGNLTALPKPRPDAVLVQDGVYSIVRHPLYGGGTFVLLGCGLATGRLSRIVVALGALAFFDAKCRREEAWLVEKFPEYVAYRRQVRKLIPLLY
jgi:protein-S-isoprenylcysteine O-methyltransferase Ste14